MKYAFLLPVISSISVPLFATQLVFNEQELSNWRIVNDGVMGGLSSSSFYIKKDVGVFAGNLSLENYGGFASIRRVGSLALSSEKQIQLKVKGDGRTYQFRLRTNRYLDGPAYAVTFKTSNKNTWQDITFSASDFHLQFRGRKIYRAPVLELKDVRQMGILIGDKVAGPFELQIRSINII